MVEYDGKDIAKCERTLLEIKHTMLDKKFPIEGMSCSWGIAAIRIDKIIGILNEVVTENHILSHDKDVLMEELDEFYNLGFPDLDDLSDQDKQEIMALLSRQEERRHFNEQS